jgi:hypothetical protein
VSDSSFAKNGSNVSTNERTAEHAEMSKNGWIESAYLDLDVVLAELKADDWLP